jgi:hypothetical protein
MAGGERLREGSVNAAESCMSSAVQIVQQTLQNSEIPATLTGTGANPALTHSTVSTDPAFAIPASNPLQNEIMGASDANPDSADPNGGNAPNAVLTIAPYTVNMDIDRLYAKPKAGGSLQFAGGYEGTAGGAAGGGIEILYRIDCYARATSASTPISGRISGVYACVATGDTCQRQI